jgi:hypothetical protein
VHVAAAGVNEPDPVEVNVTVPAGVEEVPPEAVSLTVAVQVVDWLTSTEVGVQLIEVDVVRRLTVTAEPVVSAEPEWTSSFWV